MNEHIHTTIIIVFTSSGAENTSEINIPLESKYWYLEKSLKEMKRKWDKALFSVVHTLNFPSNSSTWTLYTSSHILESPSIGQHYTVLCQKKEAVDTSSVIIINIRLFLLCSFTVQKLTNMTTRAHHKSCLFWSIWNYSFRYFAYL